MKLNSRSARTVLYSCFTAALSLSAACMESADPEATEPRSPVAAKVSTTCGQQTWVDADGNTVVDPEIYRFAVLDADLADHPDVAASIGFSKVTTCDQARTASKALLADSEAEAGFAPEVPVLAGKTDEAPISKLMSSEVLAARRGVVELSSGCTGFIVNANVIATAAHCLDQFVGENDTGSGSITIRYFDPKVGAKVNITNGAEVLTMHIHPNWAGGDYDPEDDLGVIVRATPWNNTNTSDYLRIYNDDFGRVRTMRVFGRGYNAQAGTGTGTLRTTTFNVDWFNSWYSITVAASTRRMCKGDSGGPAVKEIPNRPDMDLVTGVFVSLDINNSASLCTRDGGDQRYTRFHPTKIAWLEDVTGANCPSSTVEGLKYAQCW